MRALLLSLALFASSASAVDVYTYIPPAAEMYCPMLKGQKDLLWKLHPKPEVLCGLVEQESCISLTHSRCWNPKAELKTDREQGVGFLQITRAYNPDGSIRFDSLSAVKQLDAGLADWSWSTVYRPDLQLRALVVMSKDCYTRLSKLVKDPEQVLQLCDAAHNGGYGGMQSERRACGMRPGCDPQIWFGNVEKVCLKSTQRWKGYGKSACEINREHVFNVFNIRSKKYQKLIW